MTLKLLIFFTTCVCFLVHGSAVDRRAAAPEDAESYITLEAAKELRNKLGVDRHNRDGSTEHQPDDYDEILREIIRHLPKQQQPAQQPETFFEKKYFDYLPNEISDSDDVTSEELSHELVKMASEYVSAEDEQHVPHEEVGGGRRLKRDVQQASGGRSKRQNYFYSVPLQHYNPYPNVHFYYPLHDPIFNSFPHAAAESRNDFGQVVYNNPWTPQSNPNLRFHAPNNFYLPPATPAPTYLPVAPPYQPPVNMPHPPDNPPADTGDDDNTPDDRISIFATDEKNIWDSKPITINQSGAGRRPAPPVINPNRPNAIPIVSPNEKTPMDSVDIEFAPELQEDITTTTRASIKIPERRRNNQNSIRQKKSETTTAPAPPVQPTTESINAIYSQQQDFSNGRKPNKPLPACVEAIVNCCSKYDEIVRLPCFEAHNCNGAFFGRSPCSRDIKQSAFKEVERYTN